MFRMMIAALALAGCVTKPTPQVVKDRAANERQEERNQALKDEFNRQTSDTY